MDLFIDKFAQRKNAQELIKANYMAEAEENERLSAQVATCDEALQEVRKVSLQSLANADRTKEVLDTVIQKLSEVQKADPDAQQKVLDSISEIKTAMEEFASKQDSKLEEALAQLTGQMKEQMNELFKNAEDFNHKEAVKVYRNVQAVLEEQLTKQSQESTEKITQIVEQRKLGKGILPVCILTLVAVLVNITLVVLQILGVF